MFNESFVIVVGATAFVAAYFAPTARAIVNRYPHVVSILALNVLLGWTVIGWFLLMSRVARHGHQERPDPLHQNDYFADETATVPANPRIVAAPLPHEEERDDYAAWLKRNRNRW